VVPPSARQRDAVASPEDRLLGRDVAKEREASMTTNGDPAMNAKAITPRNSAASSVRCRLASGPSASYARSAAAIANGTATPRPLYLTDIANPPIRPASTARRQPPRCRHATI
jgi:hypothetical protein